ncbi:MAG: lecithin retinol acyltransferase family protein [Bacteroidales bacterium]
MPHIQLFENKIDLFVKQNNLKPADAIMVKKMPLKLFRHYILYLGFYQHHHIFMANTLSGIKVYSYSELMKDLQTFIPEKIERFIGTIEKRREAITRALMRKDENSYNLILNNCEHFKNWVQKGEHISIQVENIGKATVGIGAAVAIGSLAMKSKGGAIAGFSLMLLGGLAWALNDDENNIPALQYYPVRKAIK